jgi:hypothetical protein
MDALPTGTVLLVILMPTIWLVAAYWGCISVVAVRTRGGAVRPWLWIGVFTGAVAVLVATILFLLPLYLAAICWSVGAGEALRQRLSESCCGGCVAHRWRAGGHVTGLDS